jgi:hypothetical protein
MYDNKLDVCKFNNVDYKDMEEIAKRKERTHQIK